MHSETACKTPNTVPLVSVLPTGVRVHVFQLHLSITSGESPCNQRCHYQMPKARAAHELCPAACSWLSSYRRGHAPPEALQQQCVKGCQAACPGSSTSPHMPHASRLVSRMWRLQLQAAAVRGTHQTPEHCYLVKTTNNKASHCTCGGCFVTCGNQHWHNNPGQKPGQMLMLPVTGTQYKLPAAGAAAVQICTASPQSGSSIEARPHKYQQPFPSHHT